MDLKKLLQTRCSIGYCILIVLVLTMIGMYYQMSLSDCGKRIYVAIDRVPNDVPSEERGNYVHARTCGLEKTPFTDKLTEPKNSYGVKPIHKNIRRDKCFGNIKLRNIFPFKKYEELLFLNCLKDNSNPKKVQEYNRYFMVDLTSYFFSYLKQKSNGIIIELGGHKGSLARMIVDQTNIKHYVVLEPVKSFFHELEKNVKKFGSHTIFYPYNFGLGKEDRELNVKMSGVGTSMFSETELGDSQVIKIVSVYDFLISLGIACTDVDLLTINCEGCEFEVLESLVSSNLVERFVHIQFQPHYSVPNIGDFPCRYCRLVQLLSRTHDLTYRYPELWECWRRKRI